MPAQNNPSAPAKCDRVTYKDYAGIRVIGTNPVSIKAFQTDFHLQRAAYLATALEASTWGSVQSYDGAGISAGPFHWIAVYPSTMKPGPLFAILAQIRDALGIKNASKEGAPQPEKNPRWKALVDAFTKTGWYLTPDGILRDTSGKLVSGETIRNTVAPPNGCVPSSGPHRLSAEAWALTFYDLFADPETYAAQITCAIQYLVAGQKKLELGTYQALIKLKVTDPSTLRTILLGRAHVNTDLRLDEDLAMCVYHAHSVNAPGIAAECLTACQSKIESGNFSYALIRALATKKYGNWDKRYTRTRQTAQASGLWPEELFVGSNAIMPKV